ncbi:hypothetical protein PTKIN_Ptkin03bG0037200 [Pterospermum kingtungense]
MPSWGVRLEDDEDYEDKDLKYFGAPRTRCGDGLRTFTFVVKIVPHVIILREGYKENTRQHLRASPVIPETHVLATNVKLVSKPASANAMETSTTETIASKIQGLFVSSPTGSTEKATAIQETDKHVPKTKNPISLKENKWDKGVQ